jgi:hypothetical protein
MNKEKWQKCGLIFSVENYQSWAQTHAQVPTVDVLSDDVWRIYYATRDQHNRSRISFVDVEAGNPSVIIYIHDRPVLDLGRLGTFDDSGVMPSSIVNHGGVKYLYYTGWNVRQTVPYQNAIGVAVSRDNGRTFQRLGEGPVLGISLQEPHFIGTATVIVENGLWRVWYASCTHWEFLEGKAEPFYHIKYAESQDGINWNRTGEIAIDYKSHQEAGIVRASVFVRNGKYYMWYSTRGAGNYRHDISNSYRIGYAESEDGVLWSRHDSRVGIDLSDKGWDKDMIAYPCVINHQNKLYMFYNGNGFGSSGIGYAVLALH